MWSVIVILTLACGVSITEVPNFTSEESCNKAMVNVRSAFIGQSPVVMCVQK